jgi:ABC-type sugar transport system permease subunit
VRYSLSKIEFTNAFEFTYIGLKNYNNAFFVDINFRVILLNAIRSMISDILVILIFSLFIASILNQKFRGRLFARVVFFLPVILSTGIIASVESNDFIYSQSFGGNTGNDVMLAFSNSNLFSIFNIKDLLLHSNISPQIIDVIIKSVENTSLIVTSSGIQILIFMAALQSIPTSVFEAAKVEGATAWEEFWKITFPMITPMIFVNIIYTVIDTFTRPSYGIMKYINDTAFLYNNIGKSAALSFIYTIVVLIMLGIITLIISKRIQYID